MSEAETVIVKVESGLDSEIERMVPTPYRGPNKASMRTDFALRDWLRLKRESGQANGGTHGREQPAPGRDVSNPTPP